MGLLNLTLTQFLAVLLPVAAGLVVTVVDDGRGDAAQVASPGGRGLDGMRERVSAVGGQLEAGPAPGGGWRTCARMPA